MMRIQRATLNRKQLLKAGLIVCANCGWPPNNHFGWKPYPCTYKQNSILLEKVRKL